MKARSISDIRKELTTLKKEEVITMCLKLSKFSTQNKEILSYLLFYSELEKEFLIEVKDEISADFNSITNNNAYFIKKTIRKILRYIQKYSKYCSSKDIEVEIRLHFCKIFSEKGFLKLKDQVIQNIYQREISKIEKCISMLHEDLQYDYTVELELIII